MNESWVEVLFPDVPPSMGAGIDSLRAGKLYNSIVMISQEINNLSHHRGEESETIYFRILV